LQDGILTEDATKQLQLTESSFVNRTYILDMLQHMREPCKKNETCRLDFENAGSLSETDYCSLVGLSKQSFDELRKEVTVKLLLVLSLVFCRYSSTRVILRLMV
jgi:hypothetical protein